MLAVPRRMLPWLSQSSGGDGHLQLNRVFRSESTPGRTAPVEFGPARITVIAMALYRLLAAFHARKVELAPTHAVAGDAAVHLVGVLKPAGHCIMQAVTVVDAHEGARTLRA